MYRSDEYPIISVSIKPVVKPNYSVRNGKTTVQAKILLDGSEPFYMHDSKLIAKPNTPIFQWRDSQVWMFWLDMADSDNVTRGNVISIEPLEDTVVVIFEPQF
jgi:hypothetical protein